MNIIPEVEYLGYYPGVLGSIIGLHAVYYHENWGFDHRFESQVGRELSEFIRDFREGRDFFRVAKVDGQFAGSIAVDGSRADSDGVRFRWLIVNPEYQGLKIGWNLLTQAIEFCRDRNYQRVFLWTFKGLEAARVLYERAGFRLMREHEGSGWGTTILERLYELVLSR